MSEVAIPSGADALRAWQALPAADRREALRLARDSRPHPVPAVAAVAVGYARERMSRRGLDRADLMLAVVCVLGLIGSRAPVPYGSVAVLIGLAAVVTLLVRVIRRAKFRPVTLARMEMVNVHALDIQQPAEEPVDGGPIDAPDRLEVRYLRSTFLVRYVGSLGICGLLAAAMIVYGWHTHTWFVAVIGAALAVYLIVMLARSARVVLRWVLPDRPVAVIDATGLTFGPMEVTVPWSEVTGVRVVPLQALKSAQRFYGGGSGPPPAIVLFPVRDPQGALRGLRGLRPARRALRTHGTPFVLADVGIDHTSRQISAAARAHLAR